MKIERERFRRYRCYLFLQRVAFRISGLLVDQKKPKPIRALPRLTKLLMLRLLFLAFVEPSVIASVVPGHHQLLQTLILYWSRVSRMQTLGPYHVCSLCKYIGRGGEVFFNPYLSLETALEYLPDGLSMLRWAERSERSEQPRRHSSPGCQKRYRAKLY